MCAHAHAQCICEGLCACPSLCALVGVSYVCLRVCLQTSGGIRSRCTCTWTRIGPSQPIVYARCALHVASCSAMMHSRAGASDAARYGAMRLALHGALRCNASHVRRQPSGLGRAGDLLREADGRERRADGGGHQEGPVPYARHACRRINSMHVDTARPLLTPCSGAHLAGQARRFLVA